MRKLTAFVLFLGLQLGARAQAPQALNYQALARTASGAPIAAQAVNVRFTVLDGTVSGTSVYQETHTGTTNAYGLFTLAIGRGTVVSGTFAGINWGSGDKFLKVEVSTDGGTTYALQGTTQFLSVPYALYAQRTNLVAGNAINITGGNTISGAYTGGTGINVTGSTIAHALQAGPGINITGATVSGAYTGSNGVSVSGSNITGTYTGTNGVNVTGSTISGNYTGTNGVAVTGSTISGAYVGGTGIQITGATIAHNFLAGPGIQISGNTISATNSVQWATDANGINYRNPAFGFVGIGTTSVANTALSLLQPNLNGLGSAALDVNGVDTWHTVSRFRNATSNVDYQLSVAGSGNTDLPPKSIGLQYTNPPTASSHWIFNTDGTNNNFVAIGSYSFTARSPKSRLHIFNGDVNIEDIGSGIIMKSPNGACWRVTIDNSGNLVRTAITCP